MHLTSPQSTKNIIPIKVLSRKQRLNHNLSTLLLDKSSDSPIQYDVQPDIPKVRKLFFDTHAVVHLLEENGGIRHHGCFAILLRFMNWCCRFLWTAFTTQQAEALVKVLLRMTNSTLDTIYSDMVTKVQQVKFVCINVTITWLHKQCRKPLQFDQCDWQFSNLSAIHECLSKEICETMKPWKMNRVIARGLHYPASAP